MKHYEFLFLLHRAHTLRKFSKEAERRGEEFHTANAFSPLESGVFAQAHIRKIQPTDVEPVLILRVRYRPGTLRGAEMAGLEARSFYNGEFTALPNSIEDPDWVEHVYFSQDVPRPVTLADDVTPDSAPDDSGTPGAVEPVKATSS